MIATVTILAALLHSPSTGSPAERASDTRDAFPLLAARGDPEELAIPEIVVPPGTPAPRALAPERREALERLEEYLVDHAEEILERRARGVIAPGEMLLRREGFEPLRFAPLDPLAAPGRAAFVGDADREIRRVFACRQSNTEHDIDPTLVALLVEASYFFQAPIDLVSGYRARRFSARKGSRHIEGRAADVKLEGIPAEIVADFFSVLSDGPYGAIGVGRYPRRGFVHVDTRDQTYFWTDRTRRRRRHADD